MNNNTFFVVYGGINNNELDIIKVPYSNELSYLQNLVGGYIEHFIIDDELDNKKIDMWINEEGKMIPYLQPSFALLHNYKVVDLIMGTCVFTKYDDEGHTLGLTIPECDYVINWLKKQSTLKLLNKKTKQFDEMIYINKLD